MLILKRLDALPKIMNLELELLKIPRHFSSNKDAIVACFNTIGPIFSKNVQLMWIRDTLSLRDIGVSEPLYIKARERRDIILIKDPEKNDLR